MITQTLTSDPAVALELGRRLAIAARCPHHSRLAVFWSHLFTRSPRKLVPVSAY